MTENSILQLLKTCLVLETRACDIFTEMASHASLGELQEFWKQMADEERQHVRFWTRVILQAQNRLLPKFVDNPERIQRELEEIGTKIEVAYAQFHRNPNVSTALLLGYRLEFFMLHETFESIFYFMSSAGDEYNPSDSYESHIDSLVEVMLTYGEGTPEIELLGETLQYLWRKNRDLARQISQDDLTGIFNRRGFFNAAKPLLYLSHRTRKTIGIMMLDIDNFKQVNDTHGHPTGDEILKITARSIRNSVRASDIVGRYGGEEFIILFSSIDKGSLIQLSEKIRKNIENDTRAIVPVTVSIGIATGELDTRIEKRLLSLIRSADDCLYQAKNSGKNRVVICPHEPAGRGKTRPNGRQEA